MTSVVTLDKRPEQLHIGRRFSPRVPMDGLVKRRHNKFERRVQRGRALRARSTVESALVALRRRDLEVRRLATNSHEAQRYVLAARQERHES